MNKYNKIYKKWANRYKKINRKLHKNDLWGAFPIIENKRSLKCKENMALALDKAMKSGDYSMI